MKTLKFLKWLLFVLITFMIISGSSGNDLIGDVIYNISKQFHFASNEECVTVFKSDKQTLTEANESHQTVWLGPESHYGKDMEQFLIKRPKCVTLAYLGPNPEHLKDTLKLSRYIRNHINIFVGNFKPDNNTLLVIVRPLVWITDNQEATMRISLFCPRVGKPRLPEAKFIGLYLKNESRLKTIGNFGQMCANPFFGQEVLLQDSPTFPKFLTPARFTYLKELAGYNVAYQNYFARYYKFKWKTEFVSGGRFHYQNNTFGPGRFNGVMNRSVALSHGGHFPVFSPMFDLGASFWMVRIMFITRNPQPIVSYGQITAPFPLNVWILSVFLAILIAAMLHLSYHLYQKPFICHLELAKIEYHSINFYLYSLTKMTEPDPLPWFEKWTSGKVFAFWWSVFCMFMVMFYTSNLRAHLIMLEYEESPDTLDHIVKRGAVPYMYGTLRNGKKFLEAANRTHTPMYKIVLQKEKLGGQISLSKHNGFPPHVPENVMHRGDFVMVEDQAIPYFDQIYPLLRREVIYVVEEYMENYHMCYVYLKNGPATKPFDNLIRLSVDTGLINKWMMEHLPMRSVLKPKQDQVNLKPMALTSYYTSIMFYWSAVTIVSFVFLLETTKILSCNI